MADNNTHESILETLANELEKHTPGTQEHEKIFKQYMELSQLLETQRSNDIKLSLETKKLEIEQQQANDNHTKIEYEHQDRVDERDYTKEIEDLKRKDAIELAKINKSAEKLKATYAATATITAAAITAGIGYAVMKSANKSADNRLQQAISSEDLGVYTKNATKQTETNSLKTIYR